MGSYVNNDGLLNRYGTASSAGTGIGTGGEISVAGPLRCVEVEFDLDDVGSSATLVHDTVTIPNGARIEKVELVAQVLADSAGDAGVLNVGLIDQDRTTELDYNGLIAAVVQGSIDASGERTEFNVGSTYAGALIGTTLSNSGLITADYDTAAFTVGHVVVRVWFYIP